MTRYGPSTCVCLLLGGVFAGKKGNMANAFEHLGAIHKVMYVMYSSDLTNMVKHMRNTHINIHMYTCLHPFWRKVCEPCTIPFVDSESDHRAARPWTNIVNLGGNNKCKTHWSALRYINPFGLNVRRFRIRKRSGSVADQRRPKLTTHCRNKNAKHKHVQSRFISIRSG